MAIEKVREHLKKWNRDKDIREFSASTATVAEAAAALGVEDARIAKSISLKIPAPQGDRALIIVAAGDVKLDNKKYKERFETKARMLSPDEALAFTGHAVGGVCPFGIPPAVEVWLDASLKRFSTVFPACGSANSCIELTLPELEEFSGASGWVEVCVSRETPPDVV
jgi:prolyl-tRNA editing enzyme YbaK/EbsC (Cys-tRNA(Pro) deacylase)